MAADLKVRKENMTHYSEETYERLCRIYGETCGNYYKTRQEAYETIDDMIDFCRDKLSAVDNFTLLDIAFKRSK